MLLFCGCSFPLGLLKSVPPDLYTCGACTVVFSRPSWCVFVLLHNNEDLNHHSASITRMSTCEHICHHLIILLLVCFLQQISARVVRAAVHSTLCGQ